MFPWWGVIDLHSKQINDFVYKKDLEKYWIICQTWSKPTGEDNQDEGSEDSSENIDLGSFPTEHFVKIVVLGDLGVGKTSLLESYTATDADPIPLSPNNLDNSANKSDYR